MAFSSSLGVSLFILSACLSVTVGQAKEFIVGGNTNAWTVPASSSYTLNKWAEANRFQVGDSIGNKLYFPLFKFYIRFKIRNEKQN
jgi:hypothetical protein